MRGNLALRFYDAFNNLCNRFFDEFLKIHESAQRLKVWLISPKNHPHTIATRLVSLFWRSAKGTICGVNFSSFFDRQPNDRKRGSLSL